LGANALCPVTNYYWAHQIYIILSILGPPSPPYSAPIVLTAVQVYICRHQMAVNETAQHRTKTVNTWPAVYIVSLVIITWSAVHMTTWRLIKDTFNSPLLSLTNPNTNPYPNPNPNPDHTARRVHTAGRVHSHTQTYMHLLYRAHEHFP